VSIHKPGARHKSELPVADRRERRIDQAANLNFVPGSKLSLLVAVL
jgi:hypothetical protein